MEQTKSTSESIFSSLPKNALDYLIFPGVGLLSSFSLSWINNPNPTTKSGIALAGFLNAAAIGFATNYLANEKTPLHYKVLFSVVTVAGAVFATPYVAILFKDKLMTVITREAAIQIGSCHLAIKTLPYLASKAYSHVVSFLNARATSQLQSAYQSFKTAEGLQKWEALSNNDRLSYLNKFFTENLPFHAFDGETIKNMFFSRYPAVIENYTKEQASWLHAFLLSKEEQLSLTSDTAEAYKAYANLFSKNKLPPIPKLSTSQPLLPMYEGLSAEAISNSEDAAFYKDVFTDSDNWSLLSREVQIDFNEKFIQYEIEPNPLTPLPTDHFIDELFDSSIYSSERQNNWVNPTLSFSTEYKEKTECSNDPLVIIKYNEAETRRIHALFSDSNEQLNLSQDVLQAYTDLFSQYSLLFPTKHQLAQYFMHNLESPVLLYSEVTETHVQQVVAPVSKDEISSFLKVPQIIKEFSKDQAKVAHALFLQSEEEPGLSKEANQAYADIFYKYELLPPVVEGKSRIVPTTLEVPKDYSKLTMAQASWYTILIKSNRSVWTGLSLKDQFHFNESLTKHGNILSFCNCKKY